ncbi:MAG: 30S ribosomal protein S6 [Candidatus Aceula meridiana]|nr:30S ribosomal protein S6 [Candidatus Aceula meridiana]
MSKYELVVIVDAKINQDEKDGIVKNATEAVAKGGGKVINSQVWIEKQKLAFKMKHRTEGTYYLINFESPADAVAKIRPILKLNEDILRFAITKV